MDGPNKTTDINGNTICLIKKRGKVKALDEELYSEFIHISFNISMTDLYINCGVKYGGGSFTGCAPCIPA